MKKSKLSLGLVAGLMAVGALAGCDNTVKSSRDGFLLIVDGDKEHPLSITADMILGDYYNDSTKYQAIYDTVYSIIVKNYFEAVEETVEYRGDTLKLGKSEKEALVKKAKEKVEDDKETAKSNADANNTKVKKEFEEILSSKGVETEEELELQYLYELEKEKFENNFYTYHVEELKSGDESEEKITYAHADGAKQLWNGYFTQEVPYHVSHILVKLEDSSGTNYSNGTISSANATKLANVVEALGAPEVPGKQYYDSFGTIAYEYSEDGSNESWGDLGIMDYSTNYVNEFKLGVYAYENFYYKTGTARSKDSEIDLVSDIKDRYTDAVKESFDSATIPTISKSVFVELGKAAKEEYDEEKEQVLEGNSSVLPRNIIYNKYLNRHEVAFITGEAGDALAADTKKTVGYWSYSGESGLASLGLPVLSAKIDGEWMPILCVRAGSDYQGIHFIVINRSAFEKGGSESVHKVTQSDYYTTLYPEQYYYPTVDGKPSNKDEDKLTTYVNFSTDETTKTMKKAEEFASKLKSFDSDRLQKFIFKKYMKSGQITIKDADLNSALTKWIDSSIEKKVEEREETWTKTWNEYIDTLLRQNSERKNLVPQACRIAFKHGSSSLNVYDAFSGAEFDEIKQALEDGGYAVSISGGKLIVDGREVSVEDLFTQKGGLCNDGQKHL
jgi:hypothetical protein